MHINKMIKLQQKSNLQHYVIQLTILIVYLNSHVIGVHYELVFRVCLHWPHYYNNIESIYYLIV